MNPPTLAPAVFIGVQQAPEPMQPMELWNLTAPIPGHPKGSTVSRRELERLGYQMPARADALLALDKDFPGRGHV